MVPFAFLKAAAEWLLGQVGGSLFTSAKQHLLERMGLSSPPLTSSRAKSLLDVYFERLTKRLDEDRIAKLCGAFSQLKDASRSAAKQGLLNQALHNFHEVVNLPEHGRTGGHSNAELRCLAFLGMAATHIVLNDPPEFVAEKMVEAISADPVTAKHWLDEKIVSDLLAYTASLGNTSIPLRPLPVIPSTATQVPSTQPGVITYRRHKDLAYSVAWSPNGKHIVSGSPDRTAQVQIWEAHTGKQLFTFSRYKHRVLSVAWSPDGRYIASGGYDNTVKVWSVHTRIRLFTYSRYKKHKNWVQSVAWSPDSKYIASGSEDRTVQVWEARTGNTLLTFSAHGRVQSVAWSPDGKCIASGSDTYTVQVWEACTGNTLLTYRGHTSPVHSVAWSPDGKYIASGEDNHIVQVWEAHTGDTLLTYSGHERWVTSVTWSPDGRYIASGSGDKTAQVWEARTGNTLFTYSGHKDIINSVAWSPDGKYIASGSGGSDNTVQVWKAP